MNDEEYARIAQIARHYGLSVPDAIRMLLKREADRLSQLVGAQR